jgi:MFS family permease
MQSFLEKFFPEVVREMKGAKRDAYCKYDNQMLTAFTSSLYIAGMLSSLVASRVTRRVGRQAVMLSGGVLFLAGSAVNAAAVNISMLIIGRMLLGFGVGFTAQVRTVHRCRLPHLLQYFSENSSVSVEEERYYLFAPRNMAIFVHGPSLYLDNTAHSIWLKYFW